MASLGKNWISTLALSCNNYVYLSGYLNVCRVAQKYKVNFLDKTSKNASTKNQAIFNYYCNMVSISLS